MPPDPGQRPEQGPPPLRAANLGIIYVPITFSNGTFGLKLVRPPLPNSPASQLQLDVNDVIYQLDGRPFRGPEDVRNHFDETAVSYLDAGTNTAQTGTFTLPSQGP